MFVQNMTHMGLTHTRMMPNQPLPSGGMSHDKMLAFVSRAMKDGLRYMAVGGDPNSRVPIIPPIAPVAVPAASAPIVGPSMVNTNQATVNNNGLVGTVGNLLGQNNQFQASAANITPGTSPEQLATAYSGAQSGLSQQQDITNALTPGVTQGAQTQAQLNEMLLEQAQGNGPNPAQAELNQNTAQNIEQQAALQAGQRGAGANAGLVARQIAQQGAKTQQQAIGEAATLKAQQQLAAEQNLQNLTAQQVAEGATAVQGVNNAQQNEQNILQNANTAFNSANVSQQSNINSVNAGVSEANQKNAGNILGGIGGLLSNIPIVGGLFEEGGMVTKEHLHAMKKSMGGMVKRPQKYASGGVIGSPTAGPQSFVGQWLNSTPQQGTLPTTTAAPLAPDTPAADLSEAGSNIGGFIKDAFTPAEESVTGGGGGNIGNQIMIPEARGGLMEKGGKVRAHDKKEKAVKKDNALANDKIPAMLSEGEIVIPRSITTHPMAPEKAAAFVAKTLAKRRLAK